MLTVTATACADTGCACATAATVTGWAVTFDVCGTGGTVTCRRSNKNHGESLNKKEQTTTRDHADGGYYLNDVPLFGPFRNLNHNLIASQTNKEDICYPMHTAILYVVLSPEKRIPALHCELLPSLYPGEVQQEW